MTWIAFDEKTRTALNEISEAPVALAESSIDPLDYALASARNSVVLVSVGCSGEVVLLTVRKNVRVEPASPPAAQEKQETARSVHYVSSGFLGLGDEVAEEEPEQRKSWWKRWFE